MSRCGSSSRARAAAACRAGPGTAAPAFPWLRARTWRSPPPALRCGSVRVFDNALLVFFDDHLALQRRYFARLPILRRCQLYSANSYADSSAAPASSITLNQETPVNRLARSRTKSAISASPGKAESGGETAAHHCAQHASGCQRQRRLERIQAQRFHAAAGGDQHGKAGQRDDQGRLSSRLLPSSRR